MFLIFSNIIYYIFILQLFYNINMVISSNLYIFLK